jgi:NRAMP (natural resistance-associated macrophage protein)-like metal ion transporter
MARPTFFQSRWRAARRAASDAPHWGRSLLKSLGPGLVTGAADDDPSGITTYTQAGAQMGLKSLWMAVLTLPLMIGIQLISARIGWATGQGIAANARDHLPRPILWVLVLALFAANTINLGADLAAMASVAHLVVGGSPHLWLLGMAGLSLALQIGLPFPRYSPLLKGMTLTLLAYVGIVFSVQVPWGEVLVASLVPQVEGKEGWMLLVAVLGTTISPYLFFWQASHEAEERHQRENKLARGGGRLELKGLAARKHLRRIGVDTVLGMLLSNGIAFFVMLTAALTLHAHGITHVDTTAQAAMALKPIAGPLAFALFGLGIIGAGMLAVPILAGSAAYALAEAFGWPASLQVKAGAARGFYLALTAAVLIGVALNFTGTDPVRQLLWAAVINGWASVPIMMVVLVLAQRQDVMGRFAIGSRLRFLGWLATAAMALACGASIWWG